MENFKALQFLFSIEKKLNIHRDFIFLSKRKRIFTTFIILTEFVIYSFVWIDNIYFIQQVFKNNPLIFYIVIAFHSLHTFQNISLSIYFAPRFGRDFEKLLSYLCRSHDLVKHSPSYNRFLSRFKFKCTLTVIIYFVLRFALNGIILGITIPESHLNNKDISALSYFLYFAVDAWLEARYLLELVMYYSILTIITGMLQAVNELVSNMDVGLQETDLKTVSMIYMSLAEAVRRLSACFSRQILIMLFIAGTHFIFLTYRLINILITNGEVWFRKRPHILWHTVLYCTMYAIVAKRGQDVNKQVSKLIQTLAKIRVITCADRDQRWLKDFHRLVSVQLLTIELLPTVPVGMYLLPAILSLAVNYIIICLQMNHAI